MRIGEEQERRQREDNIRNRLPSALEELHESLTECLDSYKEAFGPRAATMHFVSAAFASRYATKWRRGG